MSLFLYTWNLQKQEEVAKDGGINTWIWAGVVRYGMTIIKGKKERGVGWQKEGAAPKELTPCSQNPGEIPKERRYLALK